MRGYLIQGEIIQKKLSLQLKIPQLQNVKEIDQNKIKAFLREVDLDLEYYGNLPLLHQASLEYHRVMGTELAFNIENAQKWIQSTEFIELTYALRWVYEMSSYKDRQEIQIEFDPKDQILKKIILLNIGLEQKKEISQINLIELVCDNSEILYGLSLYIQNRIETQDISTYLPLLQNMMQEGDKSAINQLIIIELIDKVLKKYSGQQDEQIKKLKLTNQIIRQIKWEEDYKQYTLQELENPNFQLRMTKQVYLYTKEQYEVKISIFKSQWEDLFTEIITSTIIQPLDILCSSLGEEEEINKEMNNPTFRKKYYKLKSSINQPNPLQSQIRVNLPPPLPLPKVKSTNISNSIYVKFNYPILENQLDGTIWKVNLIGYETKIDKQILKYFEKNQIKQTKINLAKIVVLKDEVEYGNSVFKNQTEIELKRKKFEKINLDEILEQRKIKIRISEHIFSFLILLFNLYLKIMSNKQNKTQKRPNKQSNEFRKRKLEEEDELQKQERERLKDLQKEAREQDILKYESAIR
ncbi:unnamed protein product (macronuclear) [Paramecium tetraurelia]|uniref:Uncharacterized protein n=1 Tax=Paramecium tetraurelia TaxID=5888 RepID=A0BLR2_PARTE|nr:uncharacterized protein GSPATT00030113001 [Paramecium tetraurelia]CAK59479.1 unnamed protein product [Paramecium tetraurelia]|eukprot:XP_001426877.1 hypothetical protein (macronuclear) [Paramecium tetraurelia strain d4-2]